MDPTIPHRPARISREEARGVKEREKLFAGTLKAEAKVAGWRYANGSIFRQQGDWFVSVFPSLLWGRGLTARLLAKPMAVDRLFWRIVKLPENDRLPLSFRANGAWVLRPPSFQATIALDERDPERLAHEFVAWSTDRLPQVAPFSVNGLLSEIEDLGPRRKHHVALEICLRLQLGDWDGALSLCGDRGPHESGGFGVGDKTFFDLARDWIAAERPPVI
jgi:hypothetical protein